MWKIFLTPGFLGLEKNIIQNFVKNLAGIVNLEELFLQKRPACLHCPQKICLDQLVNLSHDRKEYEVGIPFRILIFKRGPQKIKLSPEFRSNLYNII